MRSTVLLTLVMTLLPFINSYSKTVYHKNADNILIENPYETITEVQVREVDPVYSAFQEIVNKSMVSSNSNAFSSFMSADKLMIMGKQFWKIVKAGEPVLNDTTSANTMSVIPKSKNAGMTFQDMAGWSDPLYKSYEVVYKNAFGMTVVGFTYTVGFQYGGSHKGKGKYIMGVTVAASDVSVLWGFKLNAETSVVSIANVGTSRHPVASAVLKITYATSSIISTKKVSESFYFNGNGELKSLN